MKKYIQPATMVVMIQQTQMLCGSGNVREFNNDVGFFNEITEGSGNARSRELNFFDDEW
jgi:hypothetical protein